MFLDDFGEFLSDIGLGVVTQRDLVSPRSCISYSVDFDVAPDILPQETSVSEQFVAFRLFGPAVKVPRNPFLS